MAARTVSRSCQIHAKIAKNYSEERNRLDAHFSLTGQKDSPRLAYCLILKTISREDRTRLNSDSSRLLRYKALKAVIISIHFSIYPFPSGILLVSFIRSLIWSSQDIPKCHGFPRRFPLPQELVEGWHTFGKAKLTAQFQSQEWMHHCQGRSYHILT